MISSGLKPTRTRDTEEGIEWIGGVEHPNIPTFFRCQSVVRLIVDSSTKRRRRRSVKKK